MIMIYYDPLSLGQQLKKLRIEQKLNQADVALFVGVSERTVRNIEKGAVGTKAGVIFEAASELGLLLYVIEKNEEQSSYEAASLVKIGNIIRKTRKEQKIRQDDLAAIVGVQHSVLGRLERGASSVAIVTLLKCLNELGLHLCSPNRQVLSEEQ